MRRTSIFLLTLGLTVGPAAFAQDTWTNDDPLCAPEIFEQTKAAAQRQQAMAERDARATDDYYRQIKNAPSNDGKLLSCVDVSWPDVSLGSVAGIEQIIKRVGDKAVEQACNQMRKKVRDATSNFATNNLNAAVLGSVVTGVATGNYSDLVEVGTKAGVDAATKAVDKGVRSSTSSINSGLKDAGLPGNVRNSDTESAFNGLIDLIKPSAQPSPTK